VILPFAAGVISALGFLVAPIAFDLARSYPAVLDDLDWKALNRVYGEMEAEGTRQLVEAGVDPKQIVISRTADMRMVGQFHEITVSLPSGKLGAKNLAGLKSAFVHEYRRLYSHIFEGNPIMALTWRVRVAGPSPKIQLAMGESSNTQIEGDGRKAIKGHRNAYFPENGGFVKTTVYDRYGLAPGDQIQGPAILEERESTAVIAPEDTAKVDSFYNLIVNIAKK
jgi:N-methylhydantoinase A/oxoprolinase/acetone carboxylase beta subunit